jgi:predicted transposase/invertase (TIGR01784 family)
MKSDLFLSTKISTLTLEQIETMINPMTLPEPLRTDFLNSRAYKDMLALPQLGFELGLKLGLVQGLEKMKTAKITTAQKLLAMNLMTIEQITDVTDLPEKEVRALQKKKRSKKSTS